MRADIAPTNDIRVRQAVSKAIDRAAIINTVLSGNGRMNLGLVSPNTEADLLAEDEVKRLLARDLAGARQLMQNAGVTNWSPEMWVYRLQAPNVPAAEFAQAQLKEIGINGNIQLMDNVKLTSWYTAQDLPFIFAPPTAFVFGPNAYLSQVLKTGGPRNVSKLSDPELDRLIDAQAAELKDVNRRRQLLHDTQRRIIALAAMTPMFTSLDFTVQHANVRGIYAGRTNEPRYYEEVWLDQ
jgi:peptide/nickel transport system substrate-binding protein